MAVGYRVALEDGVLAAGDRIFGAGTGFNSAGVIGTGTWTWSGISAADGLYYSDISDSGSFHQATDGHIYFVPDTWQVSDLDSGTATAAPDHDGRLYGSGGDDSIAGTAGDDVIHGGATPADNAPGNDTINAGAGDDSVLGGSGSDSVQGGGGSDTISGGDGADTLMGDAATAPVAGAAWLDWSAAGAAGESIAGGFSQETGGMRVTVNITDDGQSTGATISNATQYVAADEGFATNSAAALTGSGQGDTATATLVFDAAGDSGLTDEVTAVSFRINDIDTHVWQDIVTVEAFDAAGNPVAVTLTAAGDDTVSGSTITAGPGDDRAWMANGSVRVDIAGPVHMIRIGFDNGMDGSQVITLSDVHFTTLAPADGDDIVTGGAGDDTLIGDGGNDWLAGDADDDRIVIGAGQGRDTVDGGTGQDTLAFSGATAGLAVTYATTDTGTWTWDGGSGSFAGIEHLSGSDGSDTLDARAASAGTTIAGGAGDDTISGGSGDDSLAGDDGDDSVTAGAGQDRLAMGAGNDSVDLGNDGATDRLVLADGDGIDRILGFDKPVDNGDGTWTAGDLLDVSGLTDAQGDPVNTQDVTVTDDGSGNALVAFPNGEKLILVGIAPAAISSPAALEAMGIPSARDHMVEGHVWGETIDAGYADDPDGDRVDSGDAADGSDDDLIYGYGGSDNIYAGAGHDAAYGGDDGDRVYGGTGNDTLHGEDGNDELGGAEGDDSLFGGAGNDVLFSGDGNNLLDGGAGDDQLLATDGHDTLIGGDGDDYMIAEGGDDSLDGGAGNDRMGGESGNDTLSGGDGDDQMDGGAGLDIVFGGAGKDQIDGMDDADSLFGGDGDDSINGGGGDDFVTGGAGNDYVRSSYGNDTISGGEGDDFVWGGFGDDLHLVENRFGNDTYVGYDEGETNGDTLDFSAVTDDLRIDLRHVDPEAGSFSDGTFTATYVQMEHLVLGAGQDTLVLGDDGGTDRVADFAAPVQNIDGTWTGYDLLDVTGMTSDGVTPVTTADVVVSDDGAGNALLSFPGGEALVLVGISPSAIASPQALHAMGVPLGLDHTVAGTAGDDVIDSGYAGDPEGDRVDGGDAADGSDDDVIVAGAGNDSVDAGAGDDSLSGDDGEDTLRGGAGADRMTGGDGADSIAFGEGDSVDGGKGDDRFTLEDTGESGSHDISLRGGEGFDTLDLGRSADLSTLTITGNDATGQSGTVLLKDGSLLAFKEIEKIICFTPGARIATPQGARPVESLRVGDLVVTRDHGLQPIRWIGSRTVPATDRLAPVRLRPGTLAGLDREILVSPQHRFLFRGYRAELLFGESEVLVAATHLVDGRAVTREAGGMVTYLHLLFDQHEIIYAEGAATESFHPGETGLDAVTAAAREEIFALFPELRSMPSRAGRTARTCLKRHEAELLRA